MGGGLGFRKLKYLDRDNYEGAVWLHCESHHSVSAQISSTVVLLSFYVFTRRLVGQL